MNEQLVPKGAVVVCLVAAGCVTLSLLSVYVDAVTGQLHGAGAAQWQFAFFLAPAPAVLGFLALGIAYFSRPSLSLGFKVASAVSAIAPLVLFGLVVLRVY